MNDLSKHALIKCKDCGQIHPAELSCLAAPAFLAVHTPIDWQRVRVEAAIAAMNSIITSASAAALKAQSEMTSPKIVGKLACQAADALIAELQKEVQP